MIDTYENSVTNNFKWKLYYLNLIYNINNNEKYCVFKINHLQKNIYKKRHNKLDSFNKYKSTFHAHLLHAQKYMCQFFFLQLYILSIIKRYLFI